MINKIIPFVTMFLIACPQIHAGRDGGAVAEQEALRAQEKLEQSKIEQGQQRIAQLEREIERRNIENKIAKSRARGNDKIYIFMMGLIIVLMFISLALSIVLFKRKP